MTTHAYVTAGELARELGYTRNRLVRLLGAVAKLESASLSTVQLGRRTLYRRADVLRLLGT